MNEKIMPNSWKIMSAEIAARKYGYHYWEEKSKCLLKLAMLISSHEIS